VSKRASKAVEHALKAGSGKGTGFSRAIQRSKSERLQPLR